MSEYYTVVASLPHLPALGHSDQLPISRLALQQRLTMLPAHEQAQIAMAEKLYHHSGNYQHAQDSSKVREWQHALVQLTDTSVAEQIQFKLELDAVVAAMRQRQLHQDVQSYNGFGRWRQWIVRNWQTPGFALDKVMPRMAEVHNALAHGEMHTMQLVLWRMLWQALHKVEYDTPFSFASVTCFVLRFGLAEKYIGSLSQPALDKFTTLGEQWMRESAIQQQLATLTANGAG